MTSDIFYKQLFDSYWDDIKPLMADLESRSGSTVFEPYDLIAYIFRQLSDRMARASNAPTYEENCRVALLKIKIELLGYVSFLKLKQHSAFIKKIKKADFSSHPDEAAKFLLHIEGIEKLSHDAKSYIPRGAKFWLCFVDCRWKRLKYFSMKRFSLYKVEYSKERLHILEQLNKELIQLEMNMYMCGQNVPAPKKEFFNAILQLAVRAIFPLFLFLGISPALLGKCGASFCLHYINKYAPELPKACGWSAKK